jgi:hypothetical protein
VIDGLQLVPQWIWGAIVWFVFTKLVLDRLSPKKPGTEINLAIIGSGLLPSWIVGEVQDLPPGVKLAALIDVSLAALDVIPDLQAFLEKYPPGEIGKTGATTGVNLLDDAFRVFIVGIGVITGAFRK